MFFDENERGSQLGSFTGNQSNVSGMPATCAVTLEESHIRAKSMGVQEADGGVPAEAISLDTGLRMEG